MSIIVNIFTSPTFKCSVEPLKQSCKELVGVLINTRPDQSPQAYRRNIMVSVMPATSRQVSALHALIRIVSDDGAKFSEEDRLFIVTTINESLAAIHPELRLNVDVRFDLEVTSQSSRKIGRLGGDAQLYDKLDRIVNELKPHNALDRLVH